MKPALRARPTPVVAAGFDDAIATLCVPRRKTRQRVPLGPVEDLVLMRVDGRRSLADIAALLGLSPREVLALVHRLEELGLVELPNVSGRYVVLDPEDLELEP